MNEWMINAKFDLQWSGRIRPISEELFCASVLELQDVLSKRGAQMAKFTIEIAKKEVNPRLMWSPRDQRVL